MVLLSECMSYKKTLREGLRDEYRIIQGLNYFIEVKAKIFIREYQNYIYRLDVF